LKNAQQFKPNLYDGSVIGKSNVIMLPDSENTLMHAEESRSKMIAKQNDPRLIEKKSHMQNKPFGLNTQCKLMNQLILELFTSFDQCLIDEVTEVQKIFKQMEMAVEQHCAEKTEFQTKMENVLKENDRLLTHALGVEILNIVVNDCMNRNTVSSLESAPTFAELFETNELKAQIQEKDTVILKLKEKIKSSSADDKERKVESKVEEIETQNLELDHRVTKLTAENNHLKQTYKQLFDSIKSSRVQSKEQCDDLINKVNLKSVEVADLNESLQEKFLVITALKEQLKGKAVLSKAISLNPIDPALLQVDVVPLIPKLRKNRTAHIDYLTRTLEEAATLMELVKSERLLSTLNTPLAYACKYTRWIQELLMIL
nr:pyruvate, phosphate dikinase regulatory protein, chloroplastic [Tanacetum cinerariifolium]